MSDARHPVRGPVESLERREVGRGLDAKLKDAGALFRLQVLVRVQTAERERAKLTLAGVLAGFDQLAERNWLRVAGLPVPGLGFLGSDLPLRRRWFDHRLASGLMRPARRGVVTAREVAPFLKPPTVRCPAENVLRSGALLPAAPELPVFTGQEDLVPLGRITLEGSERLVGVSLADTFFSYDAAYTAVARRHGAQLATLDGALLRAGLGCRPSEIAAELPER